jgi:hypothetical protein
MRMLSGYVSKEAPLIRLIANLLFLLIWGLAYGQTWDGCIAEGVYVRTVYDTNAPGPASAEDGKIIINPVKMRSFSPIHQRFIYWHECGHVVLGHSGTTPTQEKDADCFAVRALNSMERLTPGEVRQLLREISGLRGGRAHLPGPTRAAYLRRCGLGSRSETGQQRYRRY